MLKSGFDSDRSWRSSAGRAPGGPSPEAGLRPGRAGAAHAFPLDPSKEQEGQCVGGGPGNLRPAESRSLCQFSWVLGTGPRALLALAAATLGDALDGSCNSRDPLHPRQHPVMWPRGGRSGRN